MLGLFKRPASLPVTAVQALGASLLALPLPSGCALPLRCFAVVADAAGRTRRLAAAGSVAFGAGERAWCVHPGPYGVDLVPFAQAPEIGLRVSFVIDGGDPRPAQQRFDLYLASECNAQVALPAFAAALELALQRELAQGNLALPPCTTLDEWNAFRAGFNQLLYTRFGVTVDDCVPVDLGDRHDFAKVLGERVAHASTGQVAAAPAAAAQPAEAFAPAAVDAAALRRLFLELPCVTRGVRLAGPPGTPELFRHQQELLGRLDLVCLSAGTMPALELAAPNEALAAGEQLRRARHARRAVAALDEAWALLSRLERAGAAELPALLDEADRIVANLEHACAARRMAQASEEAAA